MTTLAARCATFAAVALVALTLTGCTSPSPSSTATAAASATPAPRGDSVLTIGTLMPVSGTFAFLGGAQTAAVALAVADINAAGGVNGAPVTLLPRDSADATTQTAEASLQDLEAQHADVVIGPTSSVIASRLIPKLVSAGIPMISPAATFPGLSTAQDSGLFFRTIPAYQDQGGVLGQVLSEKSPQAVALLYTDDELGNSIVPTLAAGLASHGSQLVASEAVPPGSTDLAPFIAAAAAAKPDVVVLATAYSSFDLTKSLITQLLSAGFGGNKLWLTTQNTGDYSQAFPNGTLAGVNGIIEGAAADDAFVARLKTIDSSLTSFRYAPEAYDATILAALAAVVARDNSGAAIARELPGVSRGGIKCTSFAECLDVVAAGDEIDYDGLSGPVNFSAVGDPSPAYYGLYTFNGENKFVFARGVVGG